MNKEKQFLIYKCKGLIDLLNILQIKKPNLAHDIINLKLQLENFCYFLDKKNLNDFAIRGNEKYGTIQESTEKIINKAKNFIEKS